MSESTSSAEKLLSEVVSVRHGEVLTSFAKYWLEHLNDPFWTALEGWSGYKIWIIDRRAVELRLSSTAAHWTAPFPETFGQLVNRVPLNYFGSGSEAFQSANKDFLVDFIKYCSAYPEMRFWQAVYNWTGVGHIFASVKNPDPYYWEGRAG